MFNSKILLRSLPVTRVTQLAERFDIDVGNLTKKRLITRIALSLANRLDDEGNTFGRVGAAKLLCAEMTRAEVLKLLRDTEFCGAEFIYSSTSAVHSLTADKARQLLMELAGAEENANLLDEVCRARRWSEYFHGEEYDEEGMELEGKDTEGEDDEDGEEREAPEDDGSELELEETEEEPEWLNALSF